MVLTGQYLRYSAHSKWGVVGSPTSNILLLKNNIVVAPALENVIVWDSRKNEKIMEFSGGTSTVTALATHDEKTISVGYSDGSIRIFDIGSGVSTVVFNGHTSAVTVLKYHHSGARLCSGSLDTNIVIWDIISQSGLYRLRGHKGPVTDCHFLHDDEILITSSKDTYIKMWCLDTQHCFETLTNGRDEVYSVTVCGNKLLAGSNTTDIRVWDIAEVALGKRKSVDKVIQCELLGSVTRKSKENVVSLTVINNIMFCLNNDTSIEVFKVKTDEEKEKLLKKKRKKSKEEDVSLAVEEEIVFVKTIKCPDKIRSISCRSITKGGVRLCCLYTTNKIQCYKLTTELETQSTSTLELPGHRSDVRCVRFTADSTRVLTVSNGLAKLWSCRTQHCITSVECGNGMCGVLTPGDQYTVIGTKKGEIQLLDLVSGVVVSSVQGHNGCIWDIAPRFDTTGFATGSVDKEVKFWEYTLEKERRLGVKHVKTLQMTEDVLSLTYSKNNKLLAVALLDCTVKVFFTDTLKFFLSLYGHKLPVTSMDISSDNSLIITGSADKNIKIWGLDFGDCHKSLFAHNEAVMKVMFVPKTHLFFSVGKDKEIKQWDADKFEHIQTLSGHHKEIWCIDVTRDGELVVTSSHDRSIRVWERSDEVIVLEDERQTAREAVYEQSLVEKASQQVDKEVEADTAGHSSMETLKGAEQIMESLEIHREEQAKEKDYQEALKADTTAPPPDKHIILSTLKVTSSNYVLSVIKKIRPSELEQALIVLPFSYIIDLLELFDRWLTHKQEVELCCKCVFFLLRIHHNQIVANKVLVKVIESLNYHTAAVIKEIKDVVGFNSAALKFLKFSCDEQTQSFYSDFTGKIKDVRKKKRAVLKPLN